MTARYPTLSCTEIVLAVESQCELQVVELRSQVESARRCERVAAWFNAMCHMALPLWRCGHVIDISRFCTPILGALNPDFSTTSTMLHT